MENRAVDALGVVLLGYKPLVAVNNLVEFVSLLLGRPIGGRIGAGIGQIHRRGVVLHHKIHPVLVPALRRGLVLQLLGRHQHPPEAIGGFLGVSRVGREENIPIRGQSAHFRGINRLPDDGKLGPTVLAELFQGLFSPAFVNSLELLLKKGGNRRVVVPLNDHSGQIGAQLGDLVEVKLLEEGPILLLPADIAHHHPPLKEIVGPQLHLPAEILDVRAHHPLQEGGRDPRTLQIPHFYGVGPDVRPREGRDTERNVSIDALVNEGDFRIRRALKRESVRSVLSEVLALPGPDASPVVEGVTGGLKIPAQIVYGPVVGVLQRQDVGFLLHEGEGFHSIGVH